MAEISLDQQRAIAAASARLRAQKEAATPSDPWQRSSIIPLAKNAETGEIAPALPKVITGIPQFAKDVVQGAVDTVTAPGRAMSGELQVMGPDGNVSPEAIGEGLNFALATTPLPPGMRAGEIIPGTTGGFRDVKIAAPTSQELRAAAKEGYESLRSLDAQYSSQSISDMAARIQASLEKNGINDKVAPKTFANLRELQAPPSGSVATSSNLETMRRTFNEIGQDFANPTDRNAGKFVRGAIDEFVNSPPSGSVLPGSEAAASQAGKVAADARGNYAAGKRSDQLSGLVESAETRAAANNSGQNIGNTIRQRAASVLDSPKLSSGFTKNELDAIRAVAKGTTGENLTRYVGNLLGGGGGLGAPVAALATGTGVAATTGNPYMAAAGIVAPIVGAASKKISNALTERSMRAVDEATRRRSPLFQEMQAAAGREPAVPLASTSFLRALMMGADGNGGGGW